MRWESTALVAALMLAGACGSARADLFDFSYTSIGGITASGTFTATLQSGNQYLVTNISGTHNGSAITGLLSTGDSFCNPSPGCDNLFFYPPNSGPTYFDANGLGFTTADGNETVLYSGGPNNYDFSNNIGNSAINFDAAPAPIPGAGALSYLLVLLGGLVRWRKTLVARVRCAPASAPQWAHTAIAAFARPRRLRIAVGAMRGWLARIAQEPGHVAIDGQPDALAAAE